MSLKTTHDCSVCKQFNACYYNDSFKIFANYYFGVKKGEEIILEHERIKLIANMSEEYRNYMIESCFKLYKGDLSKEGFTIYITDFLSQMKKEGKTNIHKSKTNINICI